jgi:hypothetical protein
METVFGSVPVFQFSLGKDISGWSEADELKFGLELNQVVF